MRRFAFLSRDVSRSRTEDQTFEQGIACEAIRAVHARARYFARGVESGNRAASNEIRFQAAHQIMRGRRDWNRFFRQINAEMEARVIDLGESFLQKVGAHVAKIQLDGFAACAKHLRVDAAADDIAWREFLPTVIS